MLSRKASRLFDARCKLQFCRKAFRHQIRALKETQQRSRWKYQSSHDRSHNISEVKKENQDSSTAASVNIKTPANSIVSEEAFHGV